MEKYREQQKYLNDSLRENTLGKEKVFTRKRFKLDQKLTINDEYTKNVFRQPFRGFWVVASSDKDFEAKMLPNINNQNGDLLDLRYNLTLDMGEYVDGCKLEFEAQAGKWIEILFFHKGFAQLGLTELDNLKLAKETLRVPSIEAITTSKVEIATISEENSRVTIINVGSNIVYIGNETVIDDADYLNLCDVIPSGEEFVYEGSKEIFSKTFMGSTSIKVIKEK
tara:strand:+ start:18216 stop:18887 length:672 start_codon:yes stop_codon:yes gene_type:complete